MFTIIKRMLTDLTESRVPELSCSHRFWKMSLYLVLVGIGTQFNASAQILSYDFNQPGTTTATSAGTNSSILNLLNTAGTAADLHSANGGGVSGMAGDYAFDNTASSGMGIGETGPRAQQPSNLSMTLSSFTVSGWFKTDGVISGSAAKIANWTTGAGNGFLLSSNNPGRLALSVEGASAVQSGTTGQTPYGAISQWVYFAVTYDGTATTNNVNFYVGSQADAVSLVSTASLNQGTVTDANSAFTVGNTVNGNNRPFDAFFDNIALYGAASGNGGVLNMTQLEALRVAAIPEPSTMALLGGTGVVLLLRTRRKYFRR